MAGRIEDFGEKIGGAKKDLWKTRALGLADLDILSVREYEEHVRKDNIWPVPDYASYLEKGMHPVCIYFMKLVRDKLPAKLPVKGDGKDRERAEYYIQFLNDVKDCCEKLRNPEDILKFRENLIYNYGYKVNNGWTDKAHKTYGFDNGFLKFIYIGQNGLAELMSECSIQNFPYEYRQELKGMTVMKSIMHGGKYIVVKGSKIIVNRSFDSPEKAVQFVRNEIIPKLESEKTGGVNRKTVRIERPQLAHIKRIGPDLRNNMDIAPEHLLEIFKFRGGEFGNWNNQADRQAYLNYAFEAFVDLAFVLRAPLDFLSLGGYQGKRLAIAFGARGSGYASAHYEPDKVVINLTKLRGAGSLAHEWAHAFDDFLGVKCGVTGVKPYLSGNYLKAKQYPEVVEAMKNVMDTIKKAPLTFDEQVERYKARIDELKNRYLKSWVDALVREFKSVSSYRPNPSEENIVNMERLKEHVISSADKNSLDEMIKLYKKIRGVLPSKDIRDNAYSLVDSVKAAQFNLEELLREGKIDSRWMKDSNYYASARKLDSGRTSPYYTEPWELFARAFEAFVEDELRSYGITSQYLVHSTNNGLYGEYKPYPEGEERHRINEQIRKMVKLAVQLFKSDEQKVNFSIYENFKANAGKSVMGNSDESTTEKIKGHSDVPKVENRDNVAVDNGIKKVEKGIERGKKAISGKEVVRDGISNIANDILPGILVTSLENTYSFIKDAVQTKLKYGVVIEGKVPIEVARGKTKCWTSSNGVVTIDSGKNTVRKLEALLEVIALVKALGKTTKKPEVGMIAKGIEFIMRYKLGLPVGNYIKAKEFEGLSRKEKDMTAYLGLCRTLCNEIVTQTGLKELFR
jgi:hypothetical protein